MVDTSSWWRHGKSCYTTASVKVFSLQCNFFYGKKIPKEVVDKLKKKSPFPACQLAVRWKGEPRDIFPDVSRRVDLVGAKHPNDHFYIVLPEQSVLPLQAITPLPDKAPPAAQGQRRIVIGVIHCTIHVRDVYQVT